MNDRYIYLLAQFDSGTQGELGEIYRELVQAGFVGKQTPGIPYHLTLGKFDMGQEKQVLDRVETLCRTIKTIDMYLSHTGLFGLNVLFVAPAINRELLELHDALIPEEPAVGIHNWVAHTTLLIDEEEAVGRALPIVSRTFSPMPARIESIGVYEFFPARHIGDFRLCR